MCSDEQISEVSLFDIWLC